MSGFWDIVFTLFVIAFLIALIIFLLSIPFIILGFGLSFVVWATCLPLPFC